MVRWIAQILAQDTDPYRNFMNPYYYFRTSDRFIIIAFQRAQTEEQFELPHLVAESARKLDVKD
jgi:hypothetical protein